MSVQPRSNGSDCPSYDLVAEHGRDQVTALVTMWGVGQGLFARQAFGNRIIPKDVRKFDRVGHRLDALGIDFGQLIDVADDLGELGRHFRKLIIGELQPGEQGDLFDVRA